jgi:glycosyltransferase involved in cell wall biosynthesis
VATIASALGDRCVVVHPGVEQFEHLDVQTVVLKRGTTTGLTRLLRTLRPRIVHVTDVWPQAVVAARLARVPRVLLTHHTPGLARRDNPAGRVWLHLAWTLRPEVIYTSESDRASDGRRPSHVVPLGIDVEQFAAGSRQQAPDGPVVGTVGRLAAQKDHATLLRAMSLIRRRATGARLVVVGDGELRDDLTRLAAELDLGDAVTFTGVREDVPDLLASFDVFALPSRFEGFCLALVEAQAAGVPVVATPVGGIPDAVADRATGLLVPPQDPAALADAVVTLLEDRALAARLAAAARQQACERFDVRLMVEATLRLYD